MSLTSVLQANRSRANRQRSIKGKSSPERRTILAHHFRVCVRASLGIIGWNELCENPAPKGRTRLAQHFRVCVGTPLAIIGWNAFCENPAPEGANELSPARRCWEKWEKPSKSRRDDQVLTQTLQCSESRKNDSKSRRDDRILTQDATSPSGGPSGQCSAALILCGKWE